MTTRYFSVLFITILSSVSIVLAGQGPIHLKLQPSEHQQQVRAADIHSLRITTYNIENFFNYVGKYERDHNNKLKPVPGKGPKPKDAKMTKQIANIIQNEIKADVLALQEIDTEQSLDRFAETEMNSEYDGIASHGNDTRGIQVGMMFNREYPFDIEIRSNVDRTWRDPSAGGQVLPVYDRDALVSIMRINGAKKPFLILINNHSKSKRERTGDHESNEKRLAQHEMTVTIYKELMTEFGDIPTIIMGDLNTSVVDAPEVSPFKQAGFVDAMEVMKVPLEKRVTHTFHPTGGATKKQQLDALFLSPSLQKYVTKAQVHPYYDAQGREKPTPDTYEERAQQPSDHRAYYIDIDVEQLIRSTL